MMERHAQAQPTLRDIWGGVLPRFRDVQKPPIPHWPPDVFALCAYALKQQSRYVRVVSTGWPPVQVGSSLESWIGGTRQIAQEWLMALSSESPSPPSKVIHLWDLLLTAIDEPLPDSSTAKWSPDWPLMELLSISDEACNFVQFDGKDPVPNTLGFMMKSRIQVLKMLAKNDHSSLCDEVPVSKLRVLPKDRTPQKGFTIRSLSLYAGLVDGQEITPRIEESTVMDDLTVNILVIPWPFVVHPSQIRNITCSKDSETTMPREFGFFSIEQPSQPATFYDDILRLLEEVESDIGKVRLVLLPELSLRTEGAKELARQLQARGTNLVCGVGETSDTGYGENYVFYSLLSSKPARQDKHHRWKLDEQQIRQYSIGAQLHIGAQYWEHIDLSNRSLSFVRLQRWLNTCVLICEDLARPDPVGDIIRAVGPNLTIALLMDGPQLRDRWPARHATILAEDPGSSVLTVTSLGMSELSKPMVGPDRSRVIAMWKDSGSSSAQEIELPADKNCLVLSLSTKEVKDWAADGRSRRATTPALTGVRFFKLPEGQAVRDRVFCRQEGPND